MEKTLESHLIDQKQAVRFIIGGNALFTVKSLKTGNRFTYKVLKVKGDDSLFEVKVMNGKDNTRDYKTIGSIKIENEMPLFVRSRSIHTKDETYTVAFDHVFMNLSIGLYMPLLEIWHEGRCCRCGRVLTVPESIISGIGPECAFKM